MESRNPVFNRSDAFSQRGYATFNETTAAASTGQLEDMYNAPAATGVQTGRMTMDDVVIKTGLMFAVLVPLAALNFYLQSPLLTWPNRIGPDDWKGWVQERSVYMPSTFDSHYTALLEMHDPGEEPNEGAILVTPYGQGTYVYTTLSLFRQLPAGNAGGARLMLNLLGAGRGR